VSGAGRGLPRRRFQAGALATAAGALAAGARGVRADEPEGPTPAEPAPSDPALTGILEGLRARHDLPALWAGRFHADGRSVSACTGRRRVDRDDAVALADFLHLGSCTKAMTALVVAREIAAGRLSFDGTLGGILPEDVPADSPWAGVTVEALLRHASGAPANADWHALHRAAPDDAVAARRGLVTWLVGHKRPAAPGFLYSNAGYALLGHLVERVRRRSWEDLLGAEILAPLGVTRFGYGPVPPEPDAPGPWGHTEHGGVVEPVRVDNPPPLGPAGRAHLPLGEWARFVLAFASGGDAARATLSIPAADWTRLLTPAEGGDYAGGWGLHERGWGGGTVLTHAGSNTTWFAVAWVAPRRDFCLLSATNTAAAGAAKGCDAAVAACLDPALLPFAAGGESSVERTVPEKSHP